MLNLNFHQIIFLVNGSCADLYEHYPGGGGWRIPAEDGQKSSNVGSSYNDKVNTIIIQPYCQVHLFTQQNFTGVRYIFHGNEEKKAGGKKIDLRVQSGHWMRGIYESTSYECHCMGSNVTVWVRGAWTTCNKSCGGGKQVQKYTCKNWEDKYNCATQSDPGKYGYTAKEVEISQDCNTFACGK